MKRHFFLQGKFSNDLFSKVKTTFKVHQCIITLQHSF